MGINKSTHIEGMEVNQHESSVLMIGLRGVDLSCVEEWFKPEKERNLKTGGSYSITSSLC